MKDSLDDMKKLFCTKGSITEDYMDAKGVINMNDTLNSRIPKMSELHHQLAVLMNSAEAVARYKDYRVRTGPTRIRAAATKVFNATIIGLSKRQQKVAKVERRRCKKESKALARINNGV